ncbi:hypothetical protein MAPG_11447 [Magnaporthiopsis poae ATCC 64411]|uniref:Tyrosinase copper-binding domain-containing protein n=1 Tax=Magnaporthiopsis poae (strain ATCC 64411 / 73-15) TaxID=644358 RepID=A0A0C4EFA8_MAGP6|nr:hypothetical protein MAPG_11447 [Magnaporthiopsis poae ATCC 64411]
MRGPIEWHIKPLACGHITKAAAGHSAWGKQTTPRFPKMRSSRLLKWAACFALATTPPVSAAPTPGRGGKHTMSDEGKKAYLDAQVCVLASPAKLSVMPGAKTRWEELLGLHQVLGLQIHSTGVFLPYHRYYVHAHEFLLNECGYKGGLPRSITSSLSVGCGAAFVAAAIEPDTYDDMWVRVYSGAHLSGHRALGMVNGDPLSSPGDPISMLHHAFVDKMWWDWQARDPAVRLTAMGGPNAQDPAVGFLEFPGGVEDESKMWGKPKPEMLAVTPDAANGDPGNVTTLSHIMTSLGVIPDATVADVMDTQGGYLCYEYI